MNKYAGTQTEKNLKAAFAGESQARNSYTFFAEIAKKEGYEQIAAIFEKTADNERAHAQMWGEELGLIGDTGKNLDAQPTGRTMSGQTCMRILQKRRSRKALRRLQRDFAWLARLRKCMKSGTGSSCGMCRHRRCLRKAV